MAKQNVYNVRFFLQRGLALGGKSQEMDVMAMSEAEAIKKAEKQHGEAFRLVGVTKVGAQG